MDALLPPPDTGQIALTASADTTLLSAYPNRNDGADLILSLAGGYPRKIVLRFSEDRIRRLLGDRELVSATLRLSPAYTGGPTSLEIRPLTVSFVEGDGNLREANPRAAMGTGATWNCAEEADIGSHAASCLQHWPRSVFWDIGSDRAARQVHYDPRTGQLSLDVSEDVRNGVHAWLIRRTHWKWSPDSSIRRDPAFYSREGATALRDPVRAPTLLLERRAGAPTSLSIRP